MSAGLKMGDKPLPTEQGYKSAYKLACEQLKNCDIEEQCQRSGAQFKVIDSKKVITVEYLNKPYQIVLPDVAISALGSKEEVPLKGKILILHYFTQAKGTPMTGKLITFKELPAGANYFPTFSKRAIRPLIERFGTEPHLLQAAARKLGGYKADYGDVAVTIDAFRRIPITLVLWRGDEEFSPEGSILFDKSISDYLPTEDINVLCETIAWKLVRLHTS